MEAPALPLLTRHALARCRSRKVPPELAVQAVVEGSRCLPTPRRAPPSTGSATSAW